MYIKETFYLDTFNELYDRCWSGALNTLDEIEELGLEDEFMDYLEETFIEDVDSTDLNDFIWFECDDWIEEHKECEE